MKEEINTWTGSLIVACAAVVFSCAMMTYVSSKLCPAKTVETVNSTVVL